MRRGKTPAWPHRWCFGTCALTRMDLGNLQAAGSGRRAAPLLGGQASPLERRGSGNPPAETRGGGGRKRRGML